MAELWVFGYGSLMWRPDFEFTERAPAALIGALFWWALASGQFDNLEGPAHRVVTDDGPPHDRQRGEA